MPGNPIEPIISLAQMLSQAFPGMHPKMLRDQFGAVESAAKAMGAFKKATQPSKMEMKAQQAQAMVPPSLKPPPQPSPGGPPGGPSGPGGLPGGPSGSTSLPQGMSLMSLIGQLIGRR